MGERIRVTVPCVCSSCFLAYESAKTGTETSLCRGRSNNSITQFHPATTVNPNHWEVQGWLFFFFSFLTKKVFFPGIQLYVTFEHQNENQDWMTLLFRFKSKHTWSSQSTGGKYIWPILSLSVSKEQIEHQKQGGAFWTPVYTCFSSERISLGKL